MIANQFDRRGWADTPLFQFLCDTFPEHRTNLDIFDVYRIAEDIGLSHTAVYNWLNKGSLTRRGATLLYEYAVSPANIGALSRIERDPPTKQDFARFLLI